MRVSATSADVMFHLVMVSLSDIKVDGVCSAYNAVMVELCMKTTRKL